MRTVVGFSDNLNKRSISWILGTGLEQAPGPRFEKDQLHFIYRSHALKALRERDFAADEPACNPDFPWIVRMEWIDAGFGKLYLKLVMPKYVIEREIPGAGKLSREELQAISQKSCGVLSNLGPQIQWVESYVMDDRVYCIYIAANEQLVREHARQGGFPANRISEVRTIIDPTTAESPTR